MSVPLLVSLLLTHLVGLVTSKGATSSCEPLGVCEKCESSEVDTELYCQKTGRKQLYFCENAVEKHNDSIYLSCLRTPGEETTRFVLFMLFMAALGFAGYYLVQQRKRLSMSLFETRKMQYQSHARK